MAGTSATSAVFDFENILPQLDFLPIAARRALDHAGLRLSLEAWRSLGLDDRCQLVAAGAEDTVDASTVAGVVRRANPHGQRIEIVGDPDPLAPPDGLTRLLEPVPLDARQWARLRALDRYALAHVHRRSIARNDPTLIQTAYEDIVMGHLRSLGPPAGDPTPRSSMGGSVAPGMQVPPPPPLPRTGGVRAALRASTPARPFSRPADPLLSPPPSRPPSLPSSLPSFTPKPSSLQRSLDELSTHLSEAGEAQMVDVGPKSITERRAVASAIVRMRRETFQRLTQRDTPKGDVLAAARIAGIQAAKRTSELIPLCHLIALTRVEVHLELDSTSYSVQVTAIAEAHDRTGVEMEALVAASVAGLTIYDMLKGIDRDMSIDDVKLLEKRGGRTGPYQRGKQ